MGAATLGFMGYRSGDRSAGIGMSYVWMYLWYLLIGVCGVTRLDAAALAADVLPRPEKPFQGKIAFSAQDAVAAWPQPPTAPAGAPNIVVILLDDVGFADTQLFGGVVQTPALAQLAAQGLRYNNFHTTALCSPTRAALLSGRNDHRAGFGEVMEGASGFPGYNGVWKKSVVPVAEVLRRNGYSTAAFGKWHNTPYWEVSPVGPFDRWPTGLGFEYFYGFLVGAASQWEPPLYRNTTPVQAPATPEQGYHFTTDITDEAIRWVQTHTSLAAEKPYLLYFATGATHAPHHVPKEWIDQYRGSFDQGWDTLREEIFARQKQLGVIPAGAELTPRPQVLPAWDFLSADQKKLFAHQMEVFAGFLAHTDHEIGRLLQVVQQGPRGDNTLILYIVGDNGSSGEGGLQGSDADLPMDARLQHMDELGSDLHMNQYTAGWAWAGSTPFQWMKQVASHFGGTTDPLVVSWPARIKDRGGLRSQFTHVNDVAATLYEVTGVRFPAAVDGVKQLPLDGTSFAFSFDKADAPSRHRMQIFEQLGNRAMYKDGWVAAAFHSPPWAFPRSEDFAHDRWELYHVAEDYSQAHDVAAQYPGKLKELQALFDREARANDIYPLNNAWTSRPFGADQPSPTAGKREFVFHAGLPRLSVMAAPNFLGSHRITADVVIPENGAQGVILADGGRYGGFVLYVKDNHLVYENNFAGKSSDVLTSPAPLPRGELEVGIEFVSDAANAASPGTLRFFDKGNAQSGAGGSARMYVGGQLVAEKQFPHFGAPTYTNYDGSFDVGRALGSPITSAYQAPFAFTGTLEKVRVKLK
ncbi:MAG: arylsulfatase [Candidatus Binatia bacterium]